MNRRTVRIWGPAAVALAWVFILQACREPKALHLSKAPPEARVARIEDGLLPPIQLRGREIAPMSLRDRLDHYKASALSLAVIDAYDVVWARAWGTMSLDRDEVATEESLFQAGSVSKPVAALVAAALAGREGLSLERPVATLLDEHPRIRDALETRVRLRHLLAHTAGLPSHSWRGWYRDEQLPSTDEMLAEVELSPVHRPGERYLYSNPGYLLLQLAIEETTGRPFAQVAAEELFAPLGVERSSFEEPLPQRLWDAAVWGHYQGAPVRGKGRMYPAAPAGLWTTPSDLARLTVELMRAAGGSEGARIPAEIAREMLTPVLPGSDRALAGSIVGSGEARRILQGGRVAGFNCYVVGYPQRGQGLVVMSNAHGSHPLNLELARAVAAEYRWPGFLELRDVVELSAEKLRRFEGRFEYEALPGTFVVLTVHEGKLFGRTGENPEWELVPIGELELMTPSSGAVLRFESDEEGRVTHFRIGLPGGSSTRVNRVDGG